MRSATDFLPSSIRLFMNFDSTTSPNLGSGRISRFSGRRRRDIGLIPYLREPLPPHRHPELVSGLIFAAGNGTRNLSRDLAAEAGRILNKTAHGELFRMTMPPAWSLRPFRAVLRTALLAVLDALGVEHAAQHVIAHAGKVAHTAAADQHHRVLLQVVALAGDVGDDLAAVGQADLGHLAQRRVRLLRGRRVDAGADAALLRVLLHRR